MVSSVGRATDQQSVCRRFKSCTKHPVSAGFSDRESGCEMRPDGERHMNNWLEMESGAVNQPVCRGLKPLQVRPMAARQIFPATQMSALRSADNAVRRSISPAGVPGTLTQLREKLRQKSQTPAGGGSRIAQAVPRARRAVGCVFSSEGSFAP